MRHFPPVTLTRSASVRAFFPRGAASRTLPPLRRGGQGGSRGAVIRLSRKYDHSTKRAVASINSRAIHRSGLNLSQSPPHHSATRPPLPPLPKGGRNGRRGTTLVITALVLTALIGLLGLVIDGGNMMFSHRKAQNAADAAATAAAMDMFAGFSTSTATATATTFVQDYNGLASATVTVNIPPASGAYSGNSSYAEAIVSFPVTLNFVQVTGVSSSQTVTARAVAGYEGTTVAAGVMQLDSTARPGITVSGNGSLKVNGVVDVNSDGGGLDKNGNDINNGNTGNAITVSGSGSLLATDVESVGGVNNTAKIANFTSGGPSPLATSAVAQADPFSSLAPPTTANGASATSNGAQSFSSGSHTLNPGVYTSISTSLLANVTLNPGIYVITGGGISMTGSSTITGNGVMIYNTGSDYNVNTGLPDSGDGSTAPPYSGSASFGSISIGGSAKFNVTGLANSSSPFDGMVIYQRRLNTKPIQLSSSGSYNIKGTTYAKWAPLNLSSNGTFNSQFFVGSLAFSGNSNLTVDSTGQNLAKADYVYLVE